jgi:hypothetical protein
MCDSTSTGPVAAAGWYPDPEQDETQRYWDGRQWTDQRAPAAAPTTSSRPSAPAAAWVAGIGAVIALIGLFLPYMESGDFGRIVDNTLIQHTEGKILIVLLLVSLLAAYRRVKGPDRSWPIAALGLIVLGMAVLLGASPPELGSAASTEGLGAVEALTVMSYRSQASPGIGVYAVGVGGLLLAGGGVALSREARHQRRLLAEPSA